MPRFVTIAPHLPIAKVAARARHAHDPVERTHGQLGWLVAQGHRVSAVAPLVGYTPNWVRAIIRRYNADSPAGLGDRRQHNRGQPPLLSPALRAELRTALDGPAPDGGSWTSPKVAAWMSNRLGRPVATARGWETLRALGFTPHRRR